MKVKVLCTVCHDEVMNLPEDARQAEAKVRLADTWLTLSSNRIHEWKCNWGHINRVWIGSPFYVLLYEKGLAELAERDTREAVTSFYSCWETFVAHTVDLLLKDFGVTGEFPKELRRSEPRLGAYAGLYFAKTKKAPSLVSSDISKVRNNVLHGEHLPSEAEAMKVAKDVQSCITASRTVLAPLHQEYSHGQFAVRAMADLKAAGFQSAGFINLAIQMAVDRTDQPIEKLIERIRAGTG